MGVRDVTTLAQKTVIIVNSNASTTASQTVADRYCEMYGIPKSNQFLYDMGSNVLWEYTTDRYASFWTDLYTKVTALGAHAVFSTAGCPVGIELLSAGDGSEGINGDGINFALLVGFIKRIHYYGVEPRLEVGGDGFYPKVGTFFDTYLWDSIAVHKATQQTMYDGVAIASLVQLTNDADYVAAGGSTVEDYQYTTYRDASPNFSTVDNLLTGHIGYYTQAEATHPATLWDLSRVILGKAGNLQVPASAQSSRVALVSPQTLSGNTRCHDSKQALIGKKLQNLGLDVKYWYITTPSATAEALLPAAGGLSWTAATLDAGTASPTCTYTYAIGCGFNNNSETTWATRMIPSTSGGICTVGQSYGNLWGKKAMVDGGHSYIQHVQTDTYGWHQTAKQQGAISDIWINLIAGRTLAEAAWCGYEYSFLAVGDPLCRPFTT